MKVASTEGWDLFEVEQKLPWRNFKLVSLTPRLRANYYLSYHTTEKRWSGSQNTADLARDHPALHAWSVALILALIAAPGNK